MSKVSTSVSLMAGVSLLFYFAGILQNTGTSTLLNLALNPELFQSTPLWVKIVSISGIITIAFGLLNNDLFVMIPVMLVLAGFGWDFVSVYQAMSVYGDAAQAFSLLLFSPLLIFYVISVIEWWRGR